MRFLIRVLIKNNGRFEIPSKATGIKGIDFIRQFFPNICLTDISATSESIYFEETDIEIDEVLARASGHFSNQNIEVLEFDEETGNETLVMFYKKYVLMQCGCATIKHRFQTDEFGKWWAKQGFKLKFEKNEEE